MAEKQEKDLQKVKELIELMKANDLIEIEVVDGDSKILLRRPGTVQPPPLVSAAPPVSSAAPVSEDAGLESIKSPIVGTFYQASNPDSAPYVKISDRVNPDTVVCVVEAMKVMNEIKAEIDGTIVEICCKDGQAIEFGQVLFKVRP